AHSFAAESSDRALRDRERPIRDRLVQIDCDRAAEAAGCRTGAEWIIETQEAGRWRTDIEIAMRAMPARGKGMLLIIVERDDVDAVFAETQRGLDRFDEPRAIGFADRDSVLDNLDARPEALDFFVGIDPDTFVLV